MARSKWVLDPSHTLAEFSVKHMMIATVKGRFSGVEGVVYADLPDFTTAEVEATIDASTVDTREGQRDAHLRSADFFDVEKFPKITFKSKRIDRNGDDYRMIGDLTIRDVTREIALDVTFEGTGKDPWGNERAGFSATGKVDRKDFGLQWNTVLETGGVLVGDQVKIAIEAELVKQAA
ncbi:MAG: YceI family protein [Bacillota bacterium]